jgi:hypothetical protein
MEMSRLGADLGLNLTARLSLRFVEKAEWQAARATQASIRVGYAAKRA